MNGFHVRRGRMWRYLALALLSACATRHASQAPVANTAPSPDAGPSADCCCLEKVTIQLIDQTPPTAWPTSEAECRAAGASCIEDADMSRCHGPEMPVE